ncbi:molybdopterin-dependent oxidoreductase [Amycolatopsis magusensis]|uniref:Biotin/methionine sulfoxide reductase n=1 Tax=Amycolatopsis magusensis TaxID=882444 RepID=A0ABS4PNZ2_9PSEU|nr:molybdopterin-dependent oxidoreductase [Amycolatopsis magusensis]MBP2181140.1 biotin/methionine sulfoxide reductase [Amycolatopsis magusensis]
MSRPHLTHWGAFQAKSDGVRLSEVQPFPEDPEPNELIHNVASAQHHPTRVDRPYVRAGWLHNGPGPSKDRGHEPFVPLEWDRAEELLGAELRRVYGQYGGKAVFGGSYGWGSAGRFHHAQSQVHRFLNTLGGYVRSLGTYSYGTSEALLPHILGDAWAIIRGSTAWEQVERHTDLIVAFGGISAKNATMSSGGVARHRIRGRLSQLRASGTRIVSVSPIADDTPAEAGAEWLAPRPGTDAALMLALAHVLITEELTDRAFLDRYTVGFDKFAADVLAHGRAPEWAAEVTGVPAERIHRLAREMAAGRTMISVSWSLQRARFGEQPLWLGVVLAAMLGQIGLPGGGFGHGYGSSAYPGEGGSAISLPALPQGHNPVREFIPVARISDMLLNPGAPYDFNGQRLSYPDIRLVYWCGGNPFHHHQDLARLREAFTRPETVVVHDPFWTATARHADFVLPSTMTVERDDFGMGNADAELWAMPALTAPHAQARDDYAIFAALAARFGVEREFTEGRDARAWLEHLYSSWRRDLPDFETFFATGVAELPMRPQDQVLLADFRADPEAAPLPTPSGRIEIHSSTIESFGYEDCPGHPVWLEPDPEPADRPLYLLANQPKSRLHSQHDVGAHSRATKHRDREPLRMHPADAAGRGLTDGDIALVRGERGSCLAAVRLSDALRPGVVQLSTGAWYDPDPQNPAFCRHGNPNVLFADVPTSTLAQGCAGAHTRVEITRHEGAVPPLSVLTPPASSDAKEAEPASEL